MITTKTRYHFKCNDCGAEASTGDGDFCFSVARLHYMNVDIEGSGEHFDFKFWKDKD